MGWGSAALTFVGQNLGARKDSRATQSGWLAAGYDAITSVLLIFAIFQAGAEILGFFSKDVAPVSIGLEYLRAVAPSYVALGAGIVLGNAMAGAGATRTTMWIDVLVILGFQAPLCLGALGIFHASRETLFRCVAATNVISVLAYAWVYSRGKWRNSAARPVELSELESS
jgi:Na+-driven multidrug efflux pump